MKRIVVTLLTVLSFCVEAAADTVFKRGVGAAGGGAGDGLGTNRDAGDVTIGGTAPDQTIAIDPNAVTGSEVANGTLGIAKLFADFTESAFEALFGGAFDFWTSGDNFEIRVKADRVAPTNVLNELDFLDALTACGTGFSPSTDGACVLKVPREEMLVDSTIEIGDSSLTNPNGIQYGLIIEGEGPCWFGISPARTNGSVFKWNGTGGALEAPVFRVESGYWVHFRDLCIQLDTDLVAGGNSASAGIQIMPTGEAGNGQVQSWSTENVVIAGPSNGTPPVGMIGVHISSTSPPPLTGQADKGVIRGSWITYVDIGIKSDALQALMNEVYDSQINGISTGVYVIGGNMDFHNSTVQCFSDNCEVFDFPFVGQLGTHKTILDNTYTEVINSGVTMIRWGEAYTSSGQPGAGQDAPLIWRNSYVNNLTAGNVDLLTGTAHTDVIVEGNDFNSMGGGTFTVKLASDPQYTKKSAMLHWRDNTVRPNNNKLSIETRSNMKLDISSGDAIKYLQGGANPGMIDVAELSINTRDPQRCILADGHDSTTLSGVGLVPLTAGTPTAQAWASTNIGTRTPKVRYTSAAAASQEVLVTTSNSLGTARALQVWTGHNYDTGGFTWYGKARLADVGDGTPTSRFAAGLFGTAAFTPTLNPSAVENSANSVYFGCDSADANLSICANDLTGAAACTTLGASFPCHTVDALYEMWLWAGPIDANGAGGTIDYRIRRLDTTADLLGSVPATNGTPQNSVALGPAIWLGSGADAADVALDFTQMCIWADY